ncbi:hypothetical protein D3C76_1222660 [compost metagenome]
MTRDRQRGEAAAQRHQRGHKGDQPFTPAEAQHGTAGDRRQGDNQQAGQHCAVEGKQAVETRLAIHPHHARMLLRQLAQRRAVFHPIHRYQHAAFAAGQREPQQTPAFTGRAGKPRIDLHRGGIQIR